MSLAEPVVVVLISAGGEWRVALDTLRSDQTGSTPFGEWFRAEVDGRAVIFVHGGWGKISAAASAQYAVDCWKPDLLVNLGTCGGIAGEIERGEVILVNSTLVYDIDEQMGDSTAAVEFYSTRLDLSWLQQPYPQAVRVTRLVSADRDLLPQDIDRLRTGYGAVAADWESGAVAWVARRNRVRCLILRGVSDLVDESGGEAYGAVEVFQSGTRAVMQSLLAALPAWLRCVQ